MSGCRVVCPHANDATIASVMLNSIFFMISPFLVELRRSKRSFFPFEFNGSKKNTPLYLNSNAALGTDV